MHGRPCVACCVVVWSCVKPCKLSTFNARACVPLTRPCVPWAAQVTKDLKKGEKKYSKRAPSYSFFFFVFQKKAIKKLGLPPKKGLFKVFSLTMRRI